MSGMYSHNKGFSLVEIFISLLVLSVGMIGLSGLHIASLRASNEAHYRTEAALLIMDLADRMRANLAGVKGHSYTSPNDVTCGALHKQCLPKFNGEVRSPCTPDEAAAFDLNVIACGVKQGGYVSGGVANLLPGGRLNVSDEIDPELILTHCKGAATCIRVAITWQEAQGKRQNAEFSEQHSIQWIVP